MTWVRVDHVWPEVEPLVERECKEMHRRIDMAVCSDRPVYVKADRLQSLEHLEPERPSGSAMMFW
jgi:hypothetical protein